MNTLVINFAFAIVMATIIVTAYLYAHRGNLKDDMLLTLLLLPLIVSTIIYTIGSNVAGAFSLAGIFSIVRFRSTQASPKEITYILLGVTAGLTSATGYYVEGIALVSLISILIVGYELITSKRENHILKILLPEDLRDGKEINQILDKYTKSYGLENIQTKDLGSLFEYVYQINMSKKVNIKEMIDELRVVNGNLTIKVTDN